MVESKVERQVEGKIEGTVERKFGTERKRIERKFWKGRLAGKIGREWESEGQFGN